MRVYAIIFLAFLALCCKHAAPQKNYLKTDTITKKADTIFKSKFLDEDWEEKGNRLRDTNYQYLNRILDKVLLTAEQHIGNNLFKGTVDTNIYHFKNMFATFQYGNIFSSDRKHLLVKRFINEYGGYEISLFTDIYILANNRFKKLVADTADIGYTEDTLMDINLDGFKDFMVSQYSGAGCCPRDDKTAFLYNSKTGDFETVGFFNPEFDNKNRLIYEMDYGSPGLVSIDKSKWSGLSKVKIESIAPTHFQDMIDSFVKPYCFTKTIYPGEKAKIIKDVPSEYKKLKNYEYFIQYQN